MLVILDYGVGNLNSIRNMLKYIGVEAVISSDLSIVQKADKFILPGVGAFDHGIRSLRSSTYFEILERKVLENKTPLLGICLGAQLLATKSEEGDLPGLGWIGGKIVRFDFQSLNQTSLKIPHMGWGRIDVKNESKLFTKMESEARFYFVHSYHWVCDNPMHVIASSTYGYSFTAGVEQNNIIGVQFHPEKSHRFGMKLLENFAKFY